MRFLRTVKLIVAITLMTLSLTALCASAATLVWNHSSGTVEGYKIYYGTSSSNPSNTIDVGSTTQYSLDTLPLAESTQYFFCVSAYNTAGESAPCPPVAYTPADSTPPAPPVGLVAE